jgi:hypothetical protein
MVYLFNNQVALAPTPQLDAFGRLRVSQPTTLFDSQQRYALDRSFASNTVSGGTVTFIPTQSSANLTVVNTSGSYAARESRYIFKYQPGKSQLALMTFVMAPASSGNLRQQVGYYGADNGYFLQLSDQVYICERSNVTGTVTHSNVAQSSWNGDKLNGSGASTINLDMSKAQIFFIDIEWLGVGSVRTGFVINGQYIVAHTFHHANVVQNAYITTASLPLRYEIQSLTASGPATSNLTQICSTVISEAGYTEPLTLFSNLTTFTSLTVGASWVPLVSIRLDPARLDSIVLMKQVEVVLTTADTLQWALWSNVTTSALTGSSFTTPPNNGSVVIDKSSTALNITNCWQVASGLATNSTGGASSSTTLDLVNYFSQLGRDSFSRTPEIFTLAVIRGTGSSAASGYALLSWQETL